MQQRHVHFTAYLALLLILIFVAGFLYGLYAFFGASAPVSPAPQQAVPFQSAPPPTAADYIAVQQPFQYLISYTDSGFHPATLSVQKGQTVRFTNNSAGTITISGAGTASARLQQGMYWQYTADTTGTTGFSAGSSSVTLISTK